MVREIKGTKLSCGVKLSVLQFRDFFIHLLNPPVVSSPIEFAEPFRQNIGLDGEITLDEVLVVLKGLKNNKAPGLDGIPYEFFKNASLSFLELLVAKFNQTLCSGLVPECFERSIIVPLFKKGDPNVPANYRGISFSNSVAKIFCGVLLNRLSEWAVESKALSECQFGFRKGYSTIDSIFVLKNVVEYRLMQKVRTYAFFIDFKAAFDSIDRRALFYKLMGKGISTKFINALKALYKNTSFAVWDGNNFSEWFVTSVGLKQGCILSPLLFSLFIDDIVDCVEDGLRIGDVVVKILLYADDIIILAETPELLQRSINKVRDYCEMWNLTVNLDKSKIMVFQKGGRRSQTEKWFFGEGEIETVREYKYLGLLLTPTLSMTKHLKERLALGKSAINTTWREVISQKDVPHSAKYKIFEAVMRSIVCYAGQVWGVKQFEDVEKILRFFLKKLFRLPRTTPNYMLHLETGLAPIYLHTLKLHFDYVCKVLTTYHSGRLPYKVCSVIINEKKLWFRDWFDLLGDDCAFMSDSFSTMADINKVNLYAVLSRVDDRFWDKVQVAAQSSQHRAIYRNLSINFGNERGYFKDDNSIQKISILFKLRGELLPLNNQPHATTPPICTLCNLQKEEDIVHFLGECPVFDAIRRSTFGKSMLTFDEVIRYLNGFDWEALFTFAVNALKYRRRIITESF